jgi:hypothetical protein
MDFFDLVGNVDGNPEFCGTCLFAGCGSNEVYRLSFILDSESDMVVRVVGGD